MNAKDALGNRIYEEDWILVSQEFKNLKAVVKTIEIPTIVNPENQMAIIPQVQVQITITLPLNQVTGCGAFYKLIRNTTIEDPTKIVM